MPKLLPPREIARFETDGYTGPVRVLDEAEAARHRAAYESVERRYPGDLKKMKTKAHLLCPWVDEIARHPRVLDAFEDLIGPDILCYSMAFRVKANDGRTHAGWHQDTAYTRMRPLLAIGALALGPCGRDQGCLSVIPGTHRGPVLPHAESSDDTSILARGQSIAAPIETEQAVDLALVPGEMAIFHYNIIHGSRPNISADRRVMLLVEMMPAHAYQASGKEAAMLVRGQDRHRNFEEDRPAIEEFGPAERQAWQNAVNLRAKVVFAESALPVSAAYGGAPKA
jgi:ectoine hydroxylase-related dioxygenase (phytanoyl-CoA dioxygenase family)